MRFVIHEVAIQELAFDPGIERMMEATGEHVAEQANATAENLFADRGDGGIGSIESHLVHSEKGVSVQISYPPEHFYMWFHELGTIHEKARPHLRPALYGAKSAVNAATALPGRPAGRITKRR